MLDSIDALRLCNTTNLITKNNNSNNNMLQNLFTISSICIVHIYNTSVTPTASAPVLSAVVAALSFINNHFFASVRFGIFTRLFGATNPKSGNDIMLGAATDCDFGITF